MVVESIKKNEKKYKNAFLKIIHTIYEDINDKEKEKIIKFLVKNLLKIKKIRYL